MFSVTNLHERGLSCPYGSKNTQLNIPGSLTNVQTFRSSDPIDPVLSLKSAHCYLAGFTDRFHSDPRGALGVLSQLELLTLTLVLIHEVSL